MADPIFGRGGLTESWAPQILSVLRIVTALLFLERGTSKILEFPYTSMSGPPAWSLFWVAGWIELIGSLLLVVGLWSRTAAFLLSGEMAIAYWMIHAPESVYPMINRGENAILFCFIFLFIAFQGPGPWSVDAWLQKRRETEEAPSYFAGKHGGADAM